MKQIKHIFSCLLLGCMLLSGSGCSNEMSDTVPGTEGEMTLHINIASAETSGIRKFDYAPGEIPESRIARFTVFIFNENGTREAVLNYPRISDVHGDSENGEISIRFSKDDLNARADLSSIKKVFVVANHNFEENYPETIDALLDTTISYWVKVNGQTTSSLTISAPPPMTGSVTHSFMQDPDVTVTLLRSVAKLRVKLIWKNRPPSLTGHLSLSSPIADTIFLFPPLVESQRDRFAHGDAFFELEQDKTTGEWTSEREMCYLFPYINNELFYTSIRINSNDEIYMGYVLLSTVRRNVVYQVNMLLQGQGSTSTIGMSTLVQPWSSVDYEVDVKPKN